MNLRHKRKFHSSTSEEKENQFGSQEPTNSKINPISQSAGHCQAEKNGNGSPQKHISSFGNCNSSTDTVIVSGNAPVKKLKTNSGAGHVQAHPNSQNVCLKSTEEIYQNQQSINNDCNIDCDGFREIFPEDLHTQLQEALYTEQTIVLREAAGPKGYNVNPKHLFAFDNVTKNHGDMLIDCRIQNPTVYGFNVDTPKNYQHTYSTTIKEYGEYAELLEADKYEEIKKKEYYQEYFSKLGNGVMFAVNIDMDDNQWKAENMILRSSLPSYLLNKGKHDMLSYHRQNVLGCTQPQMYLKVAGVWTGGHQENISVRAINVNHGDGESDWYCVDFHQVEKYRNFIKKKYFVDIHDSEGLWFGKYNDPDVIKAGIRIKKVIQRKNDIVVLAPGVLHWVRCRGRSVQTAWNFAYRRVEDIIAMNERFVYNQKINFQTIILNKTLFMDLLNFEYHNLPLDACNKIYELVSDYYQKELQFENSILHNPFKQKNQLTFYDQLPAQLKHIQIYYCNNDNCAKEIFCYFGVLKTQFAYFEYKESNYNNEFCGKYYCPQCIIEMKKVEDQIVIFRKFDLNSLKSMLKRVENFLQKNGREQPLYPIPDLTNIGHFCGQIQNINDFIYNKDVRRLEQVNIPDVFNLQGVEEMQKFQLDLQQDRLLDFCEKPIMKLFIPIQNQRCDDTELELEHSQKTEDGKSGIQPMNIKLENDQIKFEKEQQKTVSIQDQGINIENCQKEKSCLATSTEKSESNNINNLKQNNFYLEPSESSQVDLTPDQIEQQQIVKDEKLAIYLQLKQNSRTTRQQKNNSSKIIPIDISQSSTATLRGGKSICSRAPAQHHRKKSSKISKQTNSEALISQKETDKQIEVSSPTSNSTNAVNFNTSPLTNGQQQQQVKKNKRGPKPKIQPEAVAQVLSSQVNIEDNSMKIEESKIKIEDSCMKIEEFDVNEDTTIKIDNSLQNTQQQIKDKQAKNDELNNSSLSTQNTMSNIGTKNTTPNNQQTNQESKNNQDNKNGQSNSKTKISRSIDYDDDDDEDEEVKKQKKTRELERMKNLEYFNKEFEPLYQQKDRSLSLVFDQKLNHDQHITSSNDTDETELLPKKKYTLKLISNTNQHIANTN